VFLDHGPGCSVLGIWCGAVAATFVGTGLDALEDLVGDYSLRCSTTSRATLWPGSCAPA
jgi:hypothetical protein